MKIKVIWWYLFNKNKYHTYKILCWIKAAKNHYLKGRNTGICFSFKETIPKYLYKKLRKTSIYTYNAAKHFIPEYYPEYFNAKVDLYNFWWPKYDRESRIKALNKLIDIYEDKLK